MEKSSFDRLAHIANMSHELQQQGAPMKNETPEAGNFAEPSSKSGSMSLQDKMKKMACTCCRQQKSKCDAHKRHPLPCTPCTRKNLVCEINASFRRKDKRAHLARIKQEFLELKRLFQSPQTSDDFYKAAPNLAAFVKADTLSPSPSLATPFQALDPALSRPLPLGATHNIAGSLESLQPGLHYESPPKALFVPQFSAPHILEIPEHLLACEEKTVESILLSPQTIRALYLEYVRHYHPILPVVDVLKGPERIYRLSPALFWVVMFVALRRFYDDKLLLLRLSPLVKNILAEISISPITRYNPTEEDEPILNVCSVYSVQAFILYSLWPPLTLSLSADSSWNTIGAALFQAIRIGLHSSGQALETERGAMAQEQTKTWIICNIVSENIATAFGFPAFVQFDFLSTQRCSLLALTRQIMEIAHFEDQIAKTLTTGANAGPGVTHIHERIALVKVLLKQLDDLEIRLESESCHENSFRTFHYLVARVHLLTCYFLDAQNIPLFELSKGLVMLFNASMALISHVDMCEARSKDFVKYLPVVLILHLWQASCIIVKLANSPLKSVIDVAYAEKTYSAAIRLVGKASVLRHDISYRASGIMRNMWQLFRTLDEKNMCSLHLKITSRMSASVFFDCLLRLRDQVGMAKLNIETDVREQNSSNADGEDDKDDANGNLLDTSQDRGAPVSSDEEQSVPSEPRVLVGGGMKTTPGSTASSGKTRRKRQLSGIPDAESQVRKIIRMIPLDPPPIAANSRSSIFKVVSSPSFSVKSSHVSPATISSHVTTTSTSTMFPQNVPLNITSGQELPISEETFHDQSPNALNEILGNLELNFFDANNDVIWKDVDSLMDDFGFHT